MNGVVTTRGPHCGAKMPYPKRRAAILAARRLQHALGRMEAYRCLYCGAWHVGHTPKR